MLLTLSCEPPVWRVASDLPPAEGEGENVYAAFAALYNAWDSGTASPAIEVVHNGQPERGIYRIKLIVGPDKMFRASSVDILGLAMPFSTEEQFRTALPAEIERLLSSQANYRRHT